MFHHKQIMFSSRSVHDILEINIYEFTAQSQATTSFLNLLKSILSWWYSERLAHIQIRRHPEWMGSVVMGICFMQMFSKNKLTSERYCLSLLCSSFLNLQVWYEQGPASLQSVRIPPPFVWFPPSFFAPGKASHGRRHSHLGGLLCLLWTCAFTSRPFSSGLSTNPFFTGKGLLFTLAPYLGEPLKALVSAGTGDFCKGSPEQEGSSASSLWLALSWQLSLHESFIARAWK